MEAKFEKYNECIGYYEKISKNQENEGKKDCYIKLPHSANVKNPIREGECKLLSQKRDSKYTFTYDPTVYFDHLKQYSEHEGYADYIKKLEEFADLDKRENCCNCISFVVYTKPDSVESLPMYMRNVYLSVLNVEKYLPEWIVRVYLDPSVYNAIMNLSDKKNELVGYYNFISNSQNAEIYTYVCERYLFKGHVGETQNNEIIAETRSFRFIPLFDESVNACMIHEADGLVGPVECNNIKCLVESKKIFNFYTFGVGIRRYNDIYAGVSYSDWLKNYKKLIENDFYDSHLNVTDIIAGAIFANLKMKKQVFDSAVEHLVDKIGTNIIVGEEVNGVTITDNIAKLFQIGFDEMLLLEVFKNIICYDIEFEIDDSGNKKITKRSPLKELIYDIFLKNNFPYIEVSVKTDSKVRGITDVSFRTNTKTLTSEQISGKLETFKKSVNGLLEDKTFDRVQNEYIFNSNKTRMLNPLNLLRIAAVEFYISESFGGEGIYLNYDIQLRDNDFKGEYIMAEPHFSSHLGIYASSKIFEDVYKFVNGEPERVAYSSDNIILNEDIAPESDQKAIMTDSVRAILSDIIENKIGNEYDPLIRAEIKKIYDGENTEKILLRVKNRAKKELNNLIADPAKFNQKFGGLLSISDDNP